MNKQFITEPKLQHKAPSSFFTSHFTIATSSAIYVLLPYLSNLEIVLLQGLS